MKWSRYETAYRQMFDSVINVGQARSSPIIIQVSLWLKIRDLLSETWTSNLEILYFESKLKSAIRNSIPEKNQDPKCYILSCQIFPRILS